MHIAWRRAAVNGEDAPSHLRGGLGGGMQTDVRPLREKACLDWDPPPDLPRKGGGVAFFERSRLPAPICIKGLCGGGWKGGLNRRQAASAKEIETRTATPSPTLPARGR